MSSSLSRNHAVIQMGHCTRFVQWVPVDYSLCSLRLPVVTCIIGGARRPLTEHGVERGGRQREQGPGAGKGIGWTSLVPMAAIGDDGHSSSTISSSHAPAAAPGPRVQQRSSVVELTHPPSITGYRGGEHDHDHDYDHDRCLSWTHGGRPLAEMAPPPPPWPEDQCSSHHHVTTGPRVRFLAWAPTVFSAPARVFPRPSHPARDPRKFSAGAGQKAGTASPGRRVAENMAAARGRASASASATGPDQYGRFDGAGDACCWEPLGRGDAE